MTLGVFLAIGESFENFRQMGQEQLLIEQNLKVYSNAFDKVIVFSYANEYFSPYPNVYVLPNKWRLHRYCYSLFLPFLYREEVMQCDILRGLQITGGLPGIAAHLLYGKPLVINYGYSYSDMARKEGKLLQMLLYRLVEPIILENASKIITTTKTLQKKLKQYRRKLIYIPNSVNTELFRPGKKIIKTKRVVLYIGRFEPIKNLRNLIRAVAMISLDIKLLMIGSGSLKKEFQQLSKEIGVDLEIKDSIKHNHLPIEFNHADVFVLPSREEGHSKVLTEAMSCGLPVIGSLLSCIKELIKDNETGIICGFSPVEIAQAIRKVLNNPRLAEKLGRNARKCVRQHFSAAELMEKEIKLLKSFIHE